jgi:HEAT repeat protein
MASDDADKAWAEAAGQLGLKPERSAFAQRGLAGELAGVRVAVEQRTRNAGVRYTYTQVIVNSPQMTRDIQFRREGVWQGVQKGAPGKNTLVLEGIAGSESTVLALMNHETRQALLRLLQLGDVEVKPGEVGLVVPGVVSESARLVSVVRAVVDVAARLGALPSDRVRPAIENNARTDGEPGVRLRNLQWLIKSHPSSQETTRALQAALGDPDAEVRLFAATRAGQPQALAALRELVETEANPPEVRLFALEHLLSKFRYAKFAPTIAVALDAVDEQVRIAAVQAVGAKRDVAMLERVCAMIAGSRERLAGSIAKTLGQLGDPKAEPTLIKLLSYDSEQVKVAAVQALGQVGTVSALEPLLPLTKGLQLSGRIKEAAREAVHRIQAR